MFAFDRAAGVRHSEGAKTRSGCDLRGRMKKDLNDLSRFSYSHFPPFTARTHPHKYNDQYIRKKEEKGEKGREAKARVSEPFTEGGMSFSAVFNGGDLWTAQ